MYGDARCSSRNPETNRQCRLVVGHVSGHRWWISIDVNHPSWEDGMRREEWE